jgi:hypothetical protein
MIFIQKIKYLFINSLFYSTPIIFTINIFDKNNKIKNDDTKAFYSEERMHQLLNYL